MTKEEYAAHAAKAFYPGQGYGHDAFKDGIIEGATWQKHETKPVLDELIHLIERIEGAKLVGWIPPTFDTKKAQQLIKEAGREWEKP